MTKRHKLYVAAALVLLALTVCAIEVFVYLSDVTERQYSRLQIGMTGLEVERAIGRPADADENVCRSRDTYAMKQSGELAFPAGARVRYDVWTYPVRSIMITFDEEGKVVGFCLLDHRVPFWDRLKSYFKL